MKLGFPCARSSATKTLCERSSEYVCFEKFSNIELFQRSQNLIKNRDKNVFKNIGLNSAKNYCSKSISRLANCDALFHYVTVFGLAYLIC